MANIFGGLTDDELKKYAVASKEEYYKEHCRVCDGKLEDRYTWLGTMLLRRCTKCGLVYSK